MIKYLYKAVKTNSVLLSTLNYKHVANACFCCILCNYNHSSLF